MKQKIPKTALIGVFVLGIFLFTPKANADTTFSCIWTGAIPSDCNTVGTSTNGIQLYKGIYPDSSNEIFNASGLYYVGGDLNGFNVGSYITTIGTYFLRGNCIPNGCYSQLYWDGLNLYPYAQGTTSLVARFIEPYYPTNGIFSTTSPVIFSASFFNNGSDINLDSVGIILVDTDTGEQNLLYAGSGAISGQGAFSIASIISLGDTYLWRPILYSSSGSSTPVYGDWYSLSASSSPEYTPLPQTVGTATTTLPNAYNLLSFLNIPTLLETKVPFAYFFQVAQGIMQGVQSNSSQAIPSGAFVWKGINGTSTIDFFSTTTIGYYLSPSLIATWRAFLLVVLLVDFGYNLYNRAKSQHLI